MTTESPNISSKSRRTAEKNEAINSFSKYEINLEGKPENNTTGATLISLRHSQIIFDDEANASHIQKDLGNWKEKVQNILEDEGC